MKNEEKAQWVFFLKNADEESGVIRLPISCWFSLSRTIKSLEFLSQRSGVAVRSRRSLTDL